VNAVPPARNIAWQSALIGCYLEGYLGQQHTARPVLIDEDDWCL